MRLKKSTVRLLALGLTICFCGCEAAKPPEPQGPIVKKSVKGAMKSNSAEPLDPP